MFWGENIGGFNQEDARNIAGLHQVDAAMAVEIAWCEPDHSTHQRSESYSYDAKCFILLEASK